MTMSVMGFAPAAAICVLYVIFLHRRIMGSFHMLQLTPAIQRLFLFLGK